MSEPTAPASTPATTEWRRLDRRTLLTNPISVIRSVALPGAVGLVGLASSAGLIGTLLMLPFALLAAAAVGAIPWLTTRYRITPTHVEVRTGLLNRKTLTARIDRVRSVDLEAELLQRALGITRVTIGTGVDEGQINLNSLSTTEAAAVRRALLHRDTVGSPEDSQAPDPTDPTSAAAPPPSAKPVVIARLSWSWLRFAPLNLLNLAVVLGAVAAVVSQTTDLIGDLFDPDRATSLASIGLAIVIPVVALAAVALWVIGSCLGYTLRWFGLTLAREPGKDGPVLHQSAGLLTTRSATVEEVKVRGAAVRQQLLIAAAGGAELSVLTIGTEDTTPAILPAAPLPVVRQVGADILGDATPLTAALVGHGRKALGRYLRRAVLAVLVVIGGVIAVLAALDFWHVWTVTIAVGSLSLVVLLALAWVRWRNLGHTLTEHHLVSQSGALVRVRTALETDGIVGWQIRQGFFDRRLGLAQLAATTAAGDEAVHISDVPLPLAVAVASAATPDLLAPFLAHPAEQVSPVR